jgi:hypothetical protein
LLLPTRALQALAPDDSGQLRCCRQESSNNDPSKRAPATTLPRLVKTDRTGGRIDGCRSIGTMRESVARPVNAFALADGCQCDGIPARLDYRLSATLGGRCSWLLCSHLARDSEYGMSRRATAPAMPFSTANITSPSAAPDMMYTGHGPITFSSELWIGLLRRYM